MFQNGTRGASLEHYRVTPYGTSIKRKTTNQDASRFGTGYVSAQNFACVSLVVPIVYTPQYRLSYCTVLLPQAPR